MRLLCTFDNLLCKLYHFKTHHYIPGNIICSEFYFDIKIDPQSFLAPGSFPMSQLFVRWQIKIYLYVKCYILKKGNAKEWSKYCTIALISHTCKVMPQILQARFQQYMNHELPDVQALFSKGRGTRD